MKKYKKKLLIKSLSGLPLTDDEETESNLKKGDPLYMTSNDQGNIQQCWPYPSRTFI